MLRDRDLRPLDRTFASPVVPDVALFLSVSGPLRLDRTRVRSSAGKNGFLVSFGTIARIIWLTDVLGTAVSGTQEPRWSEQE